VAAASAACDSPACLFGGDCSSDSEGSLGGGNPAFRPPDHSWLTEAAPFVVRAEPSGTGVHTETPIAVVFNESMAAPTLFTSIELAEVAAGGFGPLPLLPPALVADGRVLIVIPFDLGNGALEPDTEYELRWVEDAVVTDLTGAQLSLPTDRVITRFTTASTNPAAPSLLLSFPEDGDTDQSATGEIAVVFDRPVQPNTVNAQSFVVTVNNLPPAFDPPPQPVLLIGPGAFPATDTRVWQYRSVDGTGAAASLGNGADVRVRLSPPGAGIVAIGGGVLPDTTIDFETASFAAPSSAALSSQPLDGIGIDNLAAGASAPLTLDVTLPGALGNDLIGIFLFGPNSNQSQALALFREVSVADVPYDPQTGVATLTEAELDIASSGSPLAVRFGEGPLTIALRVERGNVQSPVRLVDVDAVEPGPQDALLDITRPTFDAFGASGSQAGVFVSDQRDLCVVGRASEELRAVFVDAGAAGDNGAPFGGSATPSVVGSDEDGLFAAAPVLVGVLDPAAPPLAFTMQLYDRVLNPSSAPIDATFVQRGAGFGAPGGVLDVRVFDARTLDPIQGATVYLHEDTGGPVVFVGQATTDATGLAVPQLVFPGGEALISVDAASYDLFSYHGVPSRVVGVPLSRTSTLPGSVLGTVSSTNSEFPNFDRFLSDNAVLPEEEAAAVVSGCSFNIQTLSNECSYGPLSVRPGLLRAASFAAVDVPASAFNFTAQGFLRGYALELPLPPASGGSQTFFDLRVDRMLSDGDTPQEEKALDGPAAVLDASGLAGFDLANPAGAPRVAVQALVPGHAGSVLAGFGAALDPQGSPANAWALRSAIPGVADPTSGKYPGDVEGELVVERIIDPDSFLRVELRDTTGNRAGRRARFSALGAVVVPLDVPLLSAPLAGGTTGGQSFDLVFDNVLAPFAAGGLYRATLTGANGRDWVLYRRAAGGASRTIHVPDLVAVGGSGLPDGPIDCTVEAYEWSTLDPTQFLFSDVEREHDRFAQSAPITFDKP
jgi:hypothetical protein